MKDIQAEKEGFPKIAINKVGVRNIEMPIWVKAQDGVYISAIANISSYCDLVEDVKGINMSRISRIINSVFLPERQELITDLEVEVIKKLREAHGSKEAFFKASFKYPFHQTSPITGLPSPEVANVTIESIINDEGIKKFLTVEMVGMSLCPCSKEMSLLRNNITREEALALDSAGLPDRLINKINSAGFGAHNQKSFIKVTAEIADYFDIDEMIDIISKSTSAKVYSVLKRPDEKYVTEVSYMGGYFNGNKDFIEVEGDFGPKFVEDISRAVSEGLNYKLDKSILDYVIVVRNQESIHSNEIEAVAVLSAGRNLK